MKKNFTWTTFFSKQIFSLFSCFVPRHLIRPGLTGEEDRVKNLKWAQMRNELPMTAQPPDGDARMSVWEDDKRGQTWSWVPIYYHRGQESGLTTIYYQRHTTEKLSGKENQYFSRRWFMMFLRFYVLFVRQNSFPHRRFCDKAAK